MGPTAAKLRDRAVSLQYVWKQAVIAGGGISLRAFTFIVWLGWGARTEQVEEEL